VNLKKGRKNAKISQRVCLNLDGGKDNEGD